MNRAVQPAPTIADIDENIVHNMNETLPTLFPVRRRRRQALPVAQLPIIEPDVPLPYNDDEMALKQIQTRNLQDNIDLTCRTATARPPTHNNIPQVIEDLRPVNMDRYFPQMHPFTSIFSKDFQLKTCRDVPYQKVINKIVDQLNSKTMHFYNLPFALDTLRKGQRKDAFFSDIIRYLEDNHLPTNIKLQQSLIAEAENYLVFKTLLLHFMIKSTKTVTHKLAFCISLELSDAIFEQYHSGLMTSHQGLARTYYKIRQDFFIRSINTLLVAEYALLEETYTLTKNKEVGQIKSYMILDLWNQLVWT